jgi:hypothetical protein
MAFKIIGNRWQLSLDHTYLAGCTESNWAGVDGLRNTSTVYILYHGMSPECLDSVQVIWGVHLAPNFPWGWTDARLTPSFARPADDGHEDWDSFYVNM